MGSYLIRPDAPINGLPKSNSNLDTSYLESNRYNKSLTLGVAHIALADLAVQSVVTIHTGLYLFRQKLRDTGADDASN